MKKKKEFYELESGFKISIYKYPDFNYIRISELPEEDQDKFKRFMYGQTMSIVEGIKLQDAVYICDVENFYYQKKHGRLLFFD